MPDSSAHKDAVWTFLTLRVRKAVIAATVRGGASTPARRSFANAQLWTPQLGPKHWQVFYDTLDQVPPPAPNRAAVRSRKPPSTASTTTSPGA